jgi:hypothetical protein
MQEEMRKAIRRSKSNDRRSQNADWWRKVAEVR